MQCGLAAVAACRLEHDSAVPAALSLLCAFIIGPTISIAVLVGMPRVTDTPGNRHHPSRNAMRASFVSSSSPRPLVRADALTQATALSCSLLESAMSAYHTWTLFPWDTPQRPLALGLSAVTFAVRVFPTTAAY